MKILNCFAVAALLAALPLSAAGQMVDDEHPWTVNLNGGGVLFQDASAMETGALIGIEALYHITPRLSLGPAVDFVRVETDGSFFVAALNFGADSTRVYQVGQRIHTLHYGANLRFDVAPDSRLDPFLVGGAGAYTMYQEAQSNDDFQRITSPMFQFGGGIRFVVNEAAGIQLSVMDVVYTDFDRDQLNPILTPHRNCPTPGRSAACRFPEAERDDLPDLEETLHNIRFSLGLSYVPGLNQ